LSLCSSVLLPPTSSSSLFPYTTLFRSTTEVSDVASKIGLPPQGTVGALRTCPLCSRCLPRSALGSRPRSSSGWEQVSSLLTCFYLSIWSTWAVGAGG